MNYSPKFNGITKTTRISTNLTMLKKVIPTPVSTPYIGPINCNLESMDYADEDAAYQKYQELECLKETLQQDPVANHILWVGNKKKKLIDWAYWKFSQSGELPDSFTKSEAESIKNYYHGFKWPEHMLNKRGRVKAEYIFDEIEDKYDLDYDGLRDHINNLFEQKARLACLKKNISNKLYL